MYTTENTRWDLSDLYDGIDSKKVKSDITKLTKWAEDFSASYKGAIGKIPPESLAKAIIAYEEIEMLSGRLASFAFLAYAENMSDEERSRFYQDISETLNDISSHTLFFTLELNQIEDSAFAALLTNAEVAHYAPWLKDLRIFRPHQLSNELEELLHDKSVTGAQSWNRLFDETLVDLRFPFRNEMLTCTEILNHLSSKDATARKDAAKSLGKVLGDNKKLFTLITNVLAKDKAIEDKWRKYKNPISSRNQSNFIEDEVVDSLISSVKANYKDISHRYYAWKAKSMGMKQMNYWDRNAPLPESADSEIPYGKAVDLVLDAYGAFSPRLRQLGKKFFDNRWIDVPPSEGKDSGAFAHPTVPNAHPYLLLNYQGKVRDVMTLAHELGHGVHQLLAAKQGALMCDTPLTLAETASVFGEQLTFQEYLKRESDPAKKRIILAGKIEDMINTVIRQIAFCTFETQVHDERKHGELSSERIGEIWMGVQKESLGDAIKFEEEYQYYWAYISHFIHSPFYVYSYAFGDCLVNALYARYAEGMPNFQEEYFKLLEAGGTKHHKELLAPFGLDATKPDFWNKGLSVIKNMIDELEKLG